uniref:Sugar transporter n=1 Tax=Riptortus pedestris TaxID=329032 RepID=R4WK71_RIPPE|nr:sugar transporter [Riptortus pedestris]
MENSLIGSLSSLAPGSIITMIAIDKLGRKAMLLIYWLLIMICWIIMTITENLYAIWIAIFIGGCGASAAYLGVAVYISEIADVEVRTPLNGLSTIFMSFGSVLIYILGPLLSFKMLNLLCGGVTVSFVFFYLLVPETPYFYVAKGDLENAQKSLCWLRRGASKESIEKEMEELKNCAEQENNNKMGFRDIVSSKAILKEFGAAFFILYIYTVCGQTPIGAYLQTIYEDIPLSYSPAYAVGGISIIGVIGGFPTPFAVKLIGDKALLISSMFGCTFGLAAMSAYFYFLEVGYDVSSMTIIPVASGYFLMMLYACGLSGLIWATVSDLFPPSVKGFGTGICGIYVSLLNFFFTEVFGLFKDAYGYGPTFLGLAVMVFISTFGLFFFPSLATLSLTEIQEYFEGNPAIKRKLSHKENI